MTRPKSSIPLFNIKHDYFKNYFFCLSIIEWNNLDSNIRNAESVAIFKKYILTFIRTAANSIFHCHSPEGLKLITRLRLGLNHQCFSANFKVLMKIFEVKATLTFQTSKY